MAGCGVPTTDLREIDRTEFVTNGIYQRESRVPEQLKHAHPDARLLLKFAVRCFVEPLPLVDHPAR